MQALVLDTKLGPMLIPVSTAAQIVGAVDCEPSSHPCPWIYGEFGWRDYSVPLVNSAGALGAEVELEEPYERAVILWPMKSGKPDDFFALTSLNAPKVVDIDTQPAADRPDGLSPTAQLLGCVQLDSRIGLIPDLASLARNVFDNA